VYTRGNQRLQVAPGEGDGFGFIDPATITAVLSALNPLSWFGKGRKEADIIGPTQSQVMDTAAQIAGALGLDMGGNGTVNPNISAAQLRASLDQLDQLTRAYRAFLSNRELFPDGRASGQSASDVMPALNGTTGYDRWAAGGVPYTGPHPNPEWRSWHAPIGPGGISGGISREISRRASLPATAAPAAAAPAASSPTGLLDWIFGGGGGTPETTTAGPADFALPGAGEVPMYSVAPSTGGGTPGASLLYSGDVQQAGLVPPGLGISGAVVPLALGLALFYAASRPPRRR